MSADGTFSKLEGYLSSVPAIKPPIGRGWVDDEIWWVKFSIDIDHPLAWRVVQELGHVLNYLSLDERLPVSFKPVSPPPYMNGGPTNSLSWVIESSSPRFKPDDCAQWLEGRLPRPVHDETQWELED